MLVRYVCQRRLLERSRCHRTIRGTETFSRERCSRGGEKAGRAMRGRKSWRKSGRRCLLEPLAEKLFRRWLLNGRRSFDELRWPVSRRSNLLDTRKHFPSLSYPPMLSFVHLSIFIGGFVVNLSSTISCHRYSAKRKCNCAIKHCCSRHVKFRRATSLN